MTTPDPSTNTPSSASPSASPSASLEGPGHRRVQCVPPSPSPSEGDALNEPAAVRPPSASQHPDELPPNPTCGGITKNGSWPPPCCEVHLLPWGHDRADLGILTGVVKPDHMAGA